MADRKNVNKYYPPDWDPSKGSLNAFVGQHPLRDRAKKLDQGILTVRFELPYNVWCGGCGKHIGRGVRYNAEKRRVGEYLTTPIWAFRMKCHLCPNFIEIRTDPKDAEYVVHEGARRQAEPRNADDTEVIDFMSPEDRVKLDSDPFQRLERQTENKRKVKESETELTRLQRLSEVQTRNDYDVNRRLRKKFRTEKAVLTEVKRESQALAKKHSLALTILPNTAGDLAMARSLAFGAAAESPANRRQRALQRPLFQPTPSQRSSQPGHHQLARSEAAQRLRAAVARQPFRSGKN
ncbi:Protein saf4 [Tieghemiomyces parasiticus]|uniref:Protein saf4 n=1 Tax=Tieghemiomyces parasiticus TaxID=78921 RepID=A0A9W8AMP8_9FUNG|nr:Protein saf4 [Tieghemiomyces parasiticus]